MSRAFFRVLAVVLLALVIPAQGMASVAAGQCMTFGHHDDAGTQQYEHHAHDGADTHDHGSDKHADEGKSTHCGPCTACCASASIAAPAAAPILVSQPNTKHLFSQPEPPGVEPHRFDRPPLVL